MLSRLMLCTVMSVVLALLSDFNIANSDTYCIAERSRSDRSNRTSNIGPSQYSTLIKRSLDKLEYSPEGRYPSDLHPYAIGKDVIVVPTLDELMCYNSNLEEQWSTYTGIYPYDVRLNPPEGNIICTGVYIPQVIRSNRSLISTAFMQSRSDILPCYTVQCTMSLTGVILDWEETSLCPGTYISFLQTCTLVGEHEGMDTVNGIREVTYDERLVDNIVNWSHAVWSDSAIYYYEGMNLLSYICEDGELKLKWMIDVSDISEDMQYHEYKNDNSELWDTTSYESTRIGGIALANNDDVFVTYFPNMLCKVSAKNGAVLWRKHISVGAAPAVGSDGSVYVLDPNARLYRIIGDEVELLCHLDFENTNPFSSWWVDNGQIMIDGNDVLFISIGNRVYSISKSGETLWYVEFDRNVLTRPLIAEMHNLYVVCADSAIYAICE